MEDKEYTDDSELMVGRKKKLMGEFTDIWTGGFKSDLKEYRKKIGWYYQPEVGLHFKFSSAFVTGEYNTVGPITKFGRQKPIVSKESEETLVLTQEKTIQDQQQTIDKLTDLLIEERQKVGELESKKDKVSSEYNERLEQLINRYDERMVKLNEEITELRITIEDLSLFVKTPSLSENEIKNIRAKYIIEEEES